MGKSASFSDTLVKSLSSFCNFFLDDTLKQFWELEQVSYFMTRSPHDEKCENISRDSHIRPILRRYYDDPRYSALKRFHSLGRGLKLNPSFHHEYSAFMKEYLLSDYMKNVKRPMSFEKCSSLMCCESE
ncbi:hypothetical protein JTB14_026444 [Gonioctena quinquepunctata]|nr:hypothetical protein JTB14_026444 [Gonioctena quinquepunctata]